MGNKTPAQIMRDLMDSLDVEDTLSSSQVLMEQELEEKGGFIDRAASKISGAVSGMLPGAKNKANAEQKEDIAKKYGGLEISFYKWLNKKNFQPDEYSQLFKVKRSKTVGNIVEFLQRIGFPDDTVDEIAKDSGWTLTPSITKTTVAGPADPTVTPPDPTKATPDQEKALKQSADIKKYLYIAAEYLVLHDIKLRGNSYGSSSNSKGGSKGSKNYSLRKIIQNILNGQVKSNGTPMGQSSLNAVKQGLSSMTSGPKYMKIPIAKVKGLTKEQQSALVTIGYVFCNDGVDNEIQKVIQRLNITDQSFINAKDCNLFGTLSKDIKDTLLKIGAEVLSGQPVV